MRHDGDNSLKFQQKRDEIRALPRNLLESARIVMTRGRRRQVDTSAHFCPNPACAYRGWVRWGNLRANGHPNGGPWRQLLCVVCRITGRKFSVAQMLRFSAQIEGNRNRRGRGAQKNASDSEPA
jgi:hypothetical protein